MGFLFSRNRIELKQHTLKRRLAPWTREIAPTLTLAMPIMAGMVSHMLMGLADTVMVGHVGVTPLAASSFVNLLLHPPITFGLGLLSAVAILTSQAFGAKNPEQAGEAERARADSSQRFFTSFGYTAVGGDDFVASI